jgi:ATP-dependent helicase/nuclease subunit B
MKLVFDPDFDRGWWPGPLAEREAAAGVEWVGEAGLVGRLELALGLGGPPLSAAERAAALVPRVRSLQGFWSESAEVDPIGTAGRLLAWRDALWLAGWRGEPVAPRLAAMAEVTRDALPGAPDRLRAIAGALACRKPEIARVDLLVTRRELPRQWRDVLQALAARGATICEVALLPVPTTTRDLHRARNQPFEPHGDGSLHLLRPYGPLASAEEAAAWLASLTDLEATVVIGADPALDVALRRHGLPTTGAPGVARDGDVSLGILPLVLALAWKPADPRLALELVTLPRGPVPPSIGARLVEALQQWPAVDSDAWRQALAVGLSGIENEDRRRRVADRLAALFASGVERSGHYPVSEIEARLAVLDGWLRGVQAAAGEADDEKRWSALREQIAVMRRLLEAAQLLDLSAAQLRWLVDLATSQVPALPRFPGQAGIAAVGSPGAIAGPAHTILWWNFTLDSAPLVDRLPLSRSERGALAAIGIELPDLGRAALRAAERWRRPFLQATERLLLVAPLRREDGEEAYPHPLWDEIAARMPGGANRAAIEGGTPIFTTRPRRQDGVERPVPAPRRDWMTPSHLIRQREIESPRSLSDFLGCSFRWAVQHLGGIRAGGAGALPADQRLGGSLAHAIIEAALAGNRATPDEARHRAEALFDAEGPRLAASLFLPGADDARGQARHAVGLATERLAQILARTGLELIAGEHEMTCRHGRWQGRLRGRADLVVGHPLAVLDLKWGSSSYHRRALQNGTALQLAAYGILLQEAGSDAIPAAAYFVVKEQRLLTTEPKRFGDGERIEGPDLASVWSSFEAAYDASWTQVCGGALTAPGNPDADGEQRPGEDSLAEGRLVLSPPCTLCDLAGLCGRLYGEASA